MNDIDKQIQKHYDAIASLQAAKREMDSRNHLHHLAVSLHSLLCVPWHAYGDGCRWKGEAGTKWDSWPALNWLDKAERMVDHFGGGKVEVSLTDVVNYLGGKNGKA